MWRPGSAGPDASDTPGTLESTTVVYNARGGQSFQQQRRALPIAHYRSTLLFALEQHQVVVLVGETGCGKTTRACAEIDATHLLVCPTLPCLPSQRCHSFCMKQDGL